MVVAMFMVGEVKSLASPSDGIKNADVNTISQLERTDHFRTIV